MPDRSEVETHVRGTLNKIRNAQRNASGLKAQEEPVYELLLELIQMIKSDGVDEVETIVLSHI